MSRKWVARLPKMFLILKRKIKKKIKNLLKAPCILQGEIFAEFGITDWLRCLNGFQCRSGAGTISHNGGPASHPTMSSKSSNRRLSKTGLTPYQRGTSEWHTLLLKGICYHVDTSCFPSSSWHDNFEELCVCVIFVKCCCSDFWFVKDVVVCYVLSNPILPDTMLGPWWPWLPFLKYRC